MGAGTVDDDAATDDDDDDDDDESDVFPLAFTTVSFFSSFLSSLFSDSFLWARFPASEIL